MKRQLLIIVLLFHISACFAQIPSYIPTNGLVAWYPFTGNANDLSGNNLNGTVNGATLTTDRFGNPNAAYSYNGTSDYINMGNPSLLNITGSISISYWINIAQNPIGGYGRVIDKGIQNQSGGYISDYLSNGLIRFGGSSPFLFSDSTLSLNNWYNVIIVRNMVTDSGFIYLNGVLNATYTSLGALSTDTTPFWVGGAAASGGLPAGVFFNGKIDDLAIWNRALTPQEVTPLFNSCLNTTASITPQSATTFCQGGSVVLQASAGNSYSWSTSASTQSITVTQNGNYKVTVTDSGGCSASASQSVTVNPLPNVTFTLPAFIDNNATPITLNGSPSGGSYTGVNGISGNTLHSSQAGLGSKLITYSYTNGNNCTNTASASTILYDTSGTICTSYDTVTTHVYDTLTTSISTTDTLIINVNLTGILPPNNTNTVTVYPNPAHDHLEINVGNLSSMSGYTIKITNALGQVVFTTPVNQQSYYINLNTWTGHGVYLMYILDANQTVKSVKEIVLQ